MNDGPPVLDRPQPRHRQLLNALVRPAESRVVRLDHKEIRPRPDGVTQEVVERDLEADGVDNGRRAQGQNTNALTGNEIFRHQVNLGRHRAEEAALRHVLGERHRTTLDVALRRTVSRCPDDADVAELACRFTQHGTHERWGANRCHRRADRRRRVGVPRRIDVAGILRPEHHVGLNRHPSADLGGQPLGRGHMVVQHRPTLGIEIKTSARHIPLHSSNVDQLAASRTRNNRADDHHPYTGRGNRHSAQPTRQQSLLCPDRASLNPVGRASASSAALRATAKDTNGAPPIAASPRSGASAWEKASRPHGKPPNGSLERKASSPIHRPAKAGNRTATGLIRRWARATTAPSAAMNSASAVASASHGVAPT